MRRGRLPQQFDRAFAAAGVDLEIRQVVEHRSDAAADAVLALHRQCAFVTAACRGSIALVVVRVAEVDQDRRGTRPVLLL
jgi:hypothetical protein